MANHEEQSQERVLQRLKEQTRYCGTCNREKAPRNFCTCGGGGGGGGSDSDKKADNAKTQQQTDAKQTAAMSKSASPFDDLLATAQQLESKPLTLSNEQLWLLLSMQFDPRGSLVLSSKANLSASELKLLQQLFDKIAAEFDLFKNEAAQLGISIKEFKLELSETRLAIDLPPNYLTTFMHRLMVKGLLPTTGYTHAQENEQQQTSTSSMTPFRTEPKPPGWM